MNTVFAVLLGVFLAVPAVLFCTTRGIIRAEECYKPTDLKSDNHPGG